LGGLQFKPSKFAFEFEQSVFVGIKFLHFTSISMRTKKRTSKMCVSRDNLEQHLKYVETKKSLERQNDQICPLKLKYLPLRLLYYGVDCLLSTHVRQVAYPTGAEVSN
jgi:hypothetical protein